jgi:hypothetical protein
VALIPLRYLFADGSYQRPPQDAFVRGLVRDFDPSLVATLDVSRRQDTGLFAILDGLQRYEAMKSKGYESAWCAVYEEMDLAAEASFFYRRNRFRKAVHPYYQFNARVLMGETTANAIQTIVTRAGYVLHINAKPVDNISAIRAAEDAYKYGSEHRKESLTPTLRTLRRAVHGQKGAKDGELIRGLARLYQSLGDDEINEAHLDRTLRDLTPAELLNKAGERARRGGSRGFYVARLLHATYNDTFIGKKLPMRVQGGK